MKIKKRKKNVETLEKDLKNIYCGIGCKLILMRSSILIGLYNTYNFMDLYILCIFEQYYQISNTNGCGAINIHTFKLLFYPPTSLI